jgi:hypothetical protein
MDAVIALLLVPFALRRLEMICILRLEASTLDELATVGPVDLVRVTRLEKNCLDVMIPLIAGALNPDPLRLVHRWYGHGSLLHDTCSRKV